MTATALVPVFSGVISNTPTQLCDARALHAFMQVKRDFSNWIKGRIQKFGFMVDQDYLLKIGSPNLVNQTRGGNKKETTDYHLTLDMAKELAMVENNEQGRAARRYFIECERKVLEVAQAQSQQMRLDYSVQPGQTLSAEQAQTLRSLMTNNIAKLPKDKQAKAAIAGWSKLKAHFGVPYRQIPAHEFDEAAGILARHVADWHLAENVVAKAPAIDARGLLLALQGEADIPMPPEVQEAIDRKAMALAFEAHELSKEHLVRRVIYEAAVGGPKMHIDVAMAKKAVERGNLGEALAYTHHAELRELRSRAEFFLSGVQSFMGSLAGESGIAPSR